ncbi:MAG: HAD family hydrolase [Burkholderiales bacterium]|nr:HAD family hydrolase [Burkholderiales bacterium]
MDLALFDLDNTLLAGDSDYAWAQFLIEQGVLDRARYESRNDEFFRQYKAGTLDIHEFLRFQLAPLAAHPREQLDRWHAQFMAEKIMPMIGAAARDLVDRHITAGTLCAIVTATNSFVTGPIARTFRVPHLIATEPEVKDGRFTGGVAGTPCFQAGKVERVGAWLAGDGRSFQSFASSWFYSDSANDLPLLERVTHPVAVDPDDRLRSIAAARGWTILEIH